MVRYTVVEQAKQRVNLTVQARVLNAVWSPAVGLWKTSAAIPGMPVA
jgi:hypothetical protein